MSSEILGKRELGDDLVDAGDEDVPGHGTATVGVFEGKKVVVCARGVCSEVVL